MKISLDMQDAFIKEMEKISIAFYNSARQGNNILDSAGMLLEMATAPKPTGKKKQASFLQNVGKPIVRTGNFVAKYVRDAAGALNTMATRPIHGMVEGAKETGKQLQNSAQQMRSGGVKNALKGAFLPGMMALGLYSGVKGLRGAEDPTGMGRGKGERYGDFLGSQAGGLIGAKYGIAGNIAAGMVGQKAGALAGRAVDKIRGYTPPPGADRRMSTRALNTFSPVAIQRSLASSAPAVVQAPGVAG
jgi:hypothetical protein